MTDPRLVDVLRLEQLRDWGGDTLVQRMMVLFAEQGDARVTELETGVRSGDLEGVGRAAHSLKSSAGNIGAVQLRDIADRLEHEAALGDAEAVARLAEELSRSYHQTVSELGRIETGIPDRGET